MQEYADELVGFIESTLERNQVLPDWNGKTTLFGELNFGLTAECTGTLLRSVTSKSSWMRTPMFHLKNLRNVFLREVRERQVVN